jgi:hypothetical protein
MGKLSPILMALAESSTEGALSPIIDEVARAIGRHGLEPGRAGGSKAALRVTLERDVKRVIQVYWTPFQADVPGQSVGLHLEVAEPRVHWAECYLSPEFRNWVFCFHERPDGDIQLAYHRDYESVRAAVEGFFNLASWYVLTATDKTWDDVVYEIEDGLPWEDRQTALTGSSSGAGVQEALKKSTIIWLRWNTGNGTRTMPVWFLNDAKAGKLYVLSGERQQEIPGAGDIKECEVIFRWKGKNARIGEIPATVRLLQHGPQWDEVAEKVAEKRLNIPGTPEETARRWRDECDILELTLKN